MSDIFWALFHLAALFASFYWGWRAGEDGWFHKYKWKCPYDGCDFRVSLNDGEWAFNRVREGHLVDHWEEAEKT